MAGHLTDPLPHQAGGWSGYLADIDARVPPTYRGRARHTLLTELADGLTDAKTHYLAAGLTTADAEHRAIHDAGPPQAVARAITDYLALRHANRSTRSLLVTGPMVGALWLTTLTPGQAPVHLLARYPLLIPFLLGAAIAAGLTELITRRPALVQHQPAWTQPRNLLLLACTCTIVADAILLTTAATQLTHQPGQYLGAVALAATAASLTRCLLTARAARPALHG